MKKFSEENVYLEDMYNDNYYPKFLVDKIKIELEKVVKFLEESNYTLEDVQKKLDHAVLAINNLQEEFYENDSEIETVARDSIGMTVDSILSFFNINIDSEQATSKRDW